MGKGNGQADVRLDEQQKQDLEHELPPADPEDGFEERSAATEEKPAAAAASGAEAELKQLRAERDNLLDRLARLQAEFENARKRSARENADFRDYAVADAARALLPVIDNFNLALKNANAKPEDFRKGVELIHKQLQDVLQKMNVQPVAAQGKPFDPRVHEAIEMVESDEVPENHVVEELQPGYRIKERLLRPAMVRVAKSKQPA
ncbi:MAG TPA: nucleotide exchange factor GrpE [Terriglobales bacterium]|nr:nucleotide exchange factor GrpE [Terriglobales bacterium]